MNIDEHRWKNGTRQDRSQNWTPSPSEDAPAKAACFSALLFSSAFIGVHLCSSVVQTAFAFPLWPSFSTLEPRSQREPAATQAWPRAMEPSLGGKRRWR